MELTTGIKEIAADARILSVACTRESTLRMALKVVAKEMEELAERSSDIRTKGAGKGQQAYNSKAAEPLSPEEEIAATVKRMNGEEVA